MNWLGRILDADNLRAAWELENKKSLIKGLKLRPKKLIAKTHPKLEIKNPSSRD